MHSRVKAKIVCGILWAIMVPLLACFNEYGQKNLAGHSSEYEHGGLPFFSRSFDQTKSREFIAAHELSAIPLDDYKTRSDYAVELCRLGRYNEALMIFRPLLKKYPAEYQIASNLGTAYELVGKSDSALQTLKQSIQLYPGSHNGSEWVHLRVLEAKLKIAKDSSWLFKNQVLDMGIKKPTDPFDSMSEVNQDKIHDVIYQLEERIPFTPTPDLLMANILNETADAIALEHSITEAYILYYIGLQYNPEDLYGLKEKMEKLKPLFRKYDLGDAPDDEILYGHFVPDKPFAVKAESAPSRWYLWLLCIFIAGGVVLLIVKKK